MSDTKLWEALDLLRTGGMVAYEFGNAEGQHCARGLLREVYAGNYMIPEDLDNAALAADIVAIDAIIAEQFPERRSPYCAALVGSQPLVLMLNEMAQFNNDDATTQDELELVFEKAAMRRDEVLADA